MAHDSGNRRQETSVKNRDSSSEIQDMDQQAYRKLISGAGNGLTRPCLCFLLSGISWFYSIIISLRNFSHSRGWLKTHRVNAVVISIGNITTGGTGKTPLVIWLCKFLQQKEFRCAVLTRGYKTHTLKRATSDEQRATRTDEPAILTESCPQAKVIVNPDRVAGAAEAVNRFGAKVLIMDDGFQHRRLARDLDIVVIDATQPFGYGKMLPAGLLREPVSALKRAYAAVITRCDQISESESSQIEKKLQLANPDMIIARSIHAPICVKYSKPFVIPAEAGIQKNGETMDSCASRNDSIEQLNGKNIFAFCGIGNPDAFLNTIKRLGGNLLGSKVYNDHHHYKDKDIADIYRRAAELKADLILTTQKDWTKLIFDFRFSIFDCQDIPLAYLAVELKFLAGEDRLTGLIEDALAGKIQQE